MHATYKALSKYYANLAAETRKDAAVGSEPVDVISTITVDGVSVTERITGTVNVESDRSRDSKRLPYQSVAVKLATKVNVETLDLVMREINRGERPTVKAAAAWIQEALATFDTEPRLVAGNVRITGLVSEVVSTVDARERGIA